MRICIENDLDIDLLKLFTAVREAYAIGFSDPKVAFQIMTFCFERLKTWFQEKDLSLFVFDAIMQLNITRPLDFYRRAQAITEFMRLSAAPALIAANKRVKNILSKQGLEKETESESETTGRVLTNVDRVQAACERINDKLLKDAEEKALMQAIRQLIPELESCLSLQNYNVCLKLLTKLEKPIDAFFDKVLVMAEDAKLRNNRLAILHTLRTLFLQVADLSCLQSLASELV